MNGEKIMCPHCYEKTEWTKVPIEEEVTIKGDTLQNTYYYAKCGNCGELFENPKNINQNYLSDYSIKTIRF
jgi:uncharacterized OB-fold protein